MNDNNISSEVIKTYDKIAKNYSISKADINLVKNHLDNFIKYIKNGKIFDVGCGHGRDAKYLEDNGFNVTGIDLSENMLNIARINSPKSKFIKMDMKDLSNIQNNFLDRIWSCASLLTIPKSQVKNILFNFNRILKESGIIFISVKEGSEEGYFIGENNIKKYYTNYNKDELCKIIKDCGFKILKTNIEYKKRTWINIFAVKDNNPK